MMTVLEKAIHDNIKKYPNKYKLTPSMIRKLTILDWDRLKKKTWKNNAMLSGSWYCHTEGCGGKGVGKEYSDEYLFWIGFNEENNKIRISFTSYDGMCGYNIKKFYQVADISNFYALNMQVNTIRWLTMMIDEGILAIA